VRVFEQNFPLDDAIEFHAFALLDALPCMWPMAFLVGVHCLLLQVSTINYTTTLKVPPLNELWGLMKVLGITLAVGGAVVMATANSKGASERNDQDDTLGAILSLVNTLLFGLYMATQKKFIFDPAGSMHKRWNKYPVFVTAWSYGFGSLFMVLAAILGYSTHSVRCTFFDRELHSRMPLVRTPARVKLLLHAWDQCHSSRVFTRLYQLAL
jgi:hypothetical protein